MLVLTVWLLWRQRSPAINMVFLLSILYEKTNAWIDHLLPGWTLEKALAFIFVGWCVKLMRGFRCLVLCVEPELSPCVHLKKHEQHQKYSYSSSKKKLNKPLPGFPPSLRLKKTKTKPTSLIPTERLQEISWQDFWRSHDPRALV